MSVQLGLEVFLDSHADQLAGRKIGLVTNLTGIDHNLVSTVQRLHEHPAVNLVKLFGPEHGLRGEAQAGESVTNYPDPITGLPIYSLFGKVHKPTPDMLDGLDLLIFDMQDAGVRFYTYLTTLAYVMQAAGEHHIEIMVLDRPAPLNGLVTQGPILDPAYQSFVGVYPFPLRYGMTIGEMAQLFNGAYGTHCDLTVIPMRGWRRAMWFDDTGVPFIPGSPNLPTLTAWTVYPGTCLIEGTNLSEGRGTTRSFEYIGAPWIDGALLADRLNALSLPGVRFRPIYFVPSFSKYQGEMCSGVHVYVTNRNQLRPIDIVLHLIQIVKQQYPEQFAWRDPWSEGGHYPIDLLSGGNSVRTHLDTNGSVSDLVAQWQDDLQAFADLRAPFLLYDD